MELKIEYIAVKDLKPYEKNARKHEKKDIDNIAKSIEKYGMCDAIGIWKDNIIVEGHGRLLACKQLGIDRVPCVRLDHLTDEQRREYAIAHNATAELSVWDKDFLADELAELDFSDFDFDFGIDTDAEEETESVEDEAPEFYEENGKEEYVFSVNNILNLEYAQFVGDGKYDIPIIKKQNIKDIENTELISFNYCLSKPKYECGVHFYLHDYQFERVWNNPEKYVEILKKYKFVLSPDFSPYSDMPKATKIFNVYRNRWCGRFWQEHGINVIPTITWSDEESLGYCFDGVEKGSTIAISTMGDGKGHENLLNGWSKMIEKIQPKTILLYGDDIRDMIVFDGNIIHKEITSFIRR